MESVAHNNESSIGTTLPEAGLARSEFFIATKYGSRDVREEVRDSLKKVRLWKVGALSPIRQRQLSDLQTRGIGRKTSQERRSSPSREPDLFSLSNFPWPPNSINCMHIDLVTPLQLHVKQASFRKSRST